MKLQEFMDKRIIYNLYMISKVELEYQVRQTSLQKSKTWLKFCHHSYLPLMLEEAIKDRKYKFISAVKIQGEKIT